MLLRILAALAIVLLTTAPAEAAPLAGLVAAASSWWAGASLAVKLIIGLAVKLGVGLLEQYRARKAAGDQRRGVSLQVQMGDTLERLYLLGTRAYPGARKYIGSWGWAGKTPNAYLVDVRELSCLPSRAGPTGLQSVRIGDKYVTVLWDQPHADGRGYPVQEYRKDGTDYLWIKYLDGTQTTSDPYLLEKFGAHATRPWKPTMIGRGCQGVIMTMRRNDTLYKQGLPASLFVPKAMPLYDVRKDSTAGGSGTHRWDNPATWEASDNLAMMMYNVARGIYYGGRWVHGGRNFAAHRLPASSWMAALNEADRNMGAGRKQFCGGLEVSVGTTGLDTLDKLRLGCAGRLSESGGILKLLVGAPAAAVFAITDETILVTREQDFQPFPSISEVSNTIRATYPEPAQGWTSKDAPVRTTAALLERDDGQELAVDVDFDAVSDAAQVQCLTATMIEEAQRWRVHQFVLPPAARVLEPGFDVVSYTSEFNSYANKKFIVERIARLKGCLWQIVLRELDPADYDPPEIILPPVVGPTGPIDIPSQTADGFFAQKASIDDGAGTPRRPAILVGVAPDLDDVVAVHVRIRVKQTGKRVVDDASAIPYPRPNTGGVYQWLLSGAWCVSAGTYLVSGKLVPGSRRETLWSPEVEVTVDDIRLTDIDVYLPGMVNELLQTVGELQTWLGAGVRDLIDGARKNVLLDLDIDVGNYTQTQKVRQEVTSTAANVAATAAAELIAATGPGSALAQGILTLNATVYDPLTGLKPVSNALVATTARVAVTENSMVLLSQNLVQLSNEVEGKASNAALVATTARVTVTESGIDALTQDLVLLGNEVSGKASTTALNAMTARVTATENDIDAVSQNLIDLGVVIDGKASANAVQLLQTQVNQQGAEITSNAEALTALDVAQGKYSASGRFRISVETTPAGARSRIGFSAAADSTEANSAAAFFLEAVTGGKSRMVVVVDQFAVLNGTVRENPFIISGGVVRMNVAHIGIVEAGIIRSPDQKYIQTVATGKFEWFE